MQRVADGRLRYLLAFQDAPWRDGDEVVVLSPRDVGYRIEMNYVDDGTRGIWQVGDVWDSPDGEPDTLVMWRPPVRGV
jgi:hypothetical protein